MGKAPDGATTNGAGTATKYNGTCGTVGGEEPQNIEQGTPIVERKSADGNSHTDNEGNSKFVQR